MTSPQAVAIYARISADTQGLGLGIARQREDCEQLAASLGWPVAEVYADNDVSAYSGKRRPEYERMMSDLAEGRIDGVIVYHTDRLARRPIEVEQFLASVDAAGVRHVKFVSSPVDISTGDGLLMLRILAAMAAAESATKSRRVRRKQEQNAAAGIPHKGSTRPFGYEADHVTIREAEAEVYRQLVARFLAGESTRSLATWLNEAEVPTVRGSAWMSTTVTGMLQNPRYAGLLKHSGVVVGPGAWEPIISEEEHRQVLGRYADRKVSRRRAPQTYLLSGLCRCSKCDHPLYSAPRGSTRRYECRSGPDHGGCGGTTVVAEPVERLVTDMVLYRLDTPELDDALQGRASTDVRISTLRADLDSVTTELENLLSAYKRDDLTLPEWIEAKKPREAQQRTLRADLARLTDSSALVGLIGNGEHLRESWSTLNLDRQHSIVRAVIDHVQINPGKRGATRFDPTRVTPVWHHH